MCLSVDNTIISTKIEAKKLNFNSSKCHKLHIGEKTKMCQANLKICPDLKVNGDTMEDIENDKYLGDIISASGKLDKNFEARKNKAIGLVSQIMSLLQEISLGKHYFEIAVLLRNLMFINAVLFNSEVWYPVKDKDFEELEMIDKKLLKRFLETPSSTPSELLYLELGCIPLVEIVKSRRLMFLHYLLTRNENELLSQFFKAQCENPTKGDWVETIKQDLKDFGITENFDDIKVNKKEKFKTIVKEAAKKFAFKKLEMKKQTHSKSKTLNHSKLEMQSYLKNKKMHIEEIKFLFKLRSRMLSVKSNFKNHDHDQDMDMCILCLCPLCQRFQDDQAHILNCEKLNDVENDNTKDNNNYQNLLAENIDEIFLKHYIKRWKKRELLMGKNV